MTSRPLRLPFPGVRLALALLLLAGLGGCGMPGGALIPRIGFSTFQRSANQTVVPPDPLAGLPAAGPFDGPEDGVMVPGAPVQTTIVPRVLRQDATLTLTAVASYDIRARVLHTEHYWLDEGADLVPMDVALGWQTMSSNRLLRHLVIQQTRRFYTWSPLIDTFSRRTIETESSNNHLIPATPAVRARMNDLEMGQLVELRGYLVNIDQPNGDGWHSSLTREDTGDGACELMYVTDVLWLRREPVVTAQPDRKP